MENRFLDDLEPLDSGSLAQPDSSCSSLFRTPTIQLMTPTTSIDSQSAEKYDQILGEMIQDTTEYDMQSNAIQRLIQALTKVKSKIVDSQKLGNKEGLLFHEVLSQFSNPTFTKEDVYILVQQTGYTERKIRDFFRNQRKRTFKPIYNALAEEMTDLKRRVCEISPYDQQYIDELCAKKTLIGDVLEFSMA